MKECAKFGLNIWSSNSCCFQSNCFPFITPTREKDWKIRHFQKIIYIWRDNAIQLIVSLFDFIYNCSSISNNGEQQRDIENNSSLRHLVLNCNIHSKILTELLVVTFSAWDWEAIWSFHHLDSDPQVFC